MRTNKINARSGQKLAIVALGLIVVLLTIGVVVLLLRPSVIVSNFEQCREAGGSLLESYPEQCMINGSSFTNSAQSIDFDTGDYVGMEENDAMTKAKKSDVPARVVEREGEGLPVTMDFVFGRHNFYVKDGKVYKDETEGLATDSGR